MQMQQRILKILLSIAVMFGFSAVAFGQETTDTISTVVIDSAPKKLYSELYSDENGNQFMVEIYEEPQEGENLIHFRSFKNGQIIGRKSQALADAHDFTFFIDETEERLMREDSAQLLYEVLKRLMDESDQKLKSKLEDMFDQEEMAEKLSEKIRTPEDQIASMADQISDQITFDGGTVKNMAERISKQIKTPDEQISKMATRISKEMRTPDDQIQAMADQISDQITFDGGTVKNMAERISKQIKTPDEEISKMATRISREMRTPDDQIKALASQISREVRTPDDQIKALASQISREVRTPDDQIKALASQISREVRTPDDQIKALATQISEEVRTPDDQIQAMADQISDQITFDGGTVKDMAERISRQIKTPDDQITDMASRISKEVRTPDDQIENMALSLAIKLTQKEKLVAARIPPYTDLITQVSDSNEQQDYEKTIEILDEDIANRTPDEQRKALKISGLMSVLVASKKLKRAISTIEDYDLPDDPELRQVSKALSDWLSKHLVID
jgi:flagellar capping protein FliD